MLKVMVVDDSAVARQMLVRILNSDPDLKVVAQASDGAQAVTLAESVQPDVITMDVNMPVMDGLEATRTIMERMPTPIILISSGYDATEVQETFSVLEAGALTVLGKPGNPASPEFARQAAEVVSTIKNLARVKVVTRRRRRAPGERVVAPANDSPTPTLAPRTARPRDVSFDLLAIGASTGGPAALARILSEMPADLPLPVVVVQHIARGFDRGFAGWLDRVSPLCVRLARNREDLAPGLVLVAPHDRHLGVTSDGRVALSAAPPIGGHRPSATHLFRSVAQAYGPRALGVILTGMGEDGVPGLVELRRVGGRVLAQDEASSVVYGMPRAARELGAVDWVVGLDEVASTIIGVVTRRAAARS